MIQFLPIISELAGGWLKGKAEKQAASNKVKVAKAEAEAEVMRVAARHEAGWEKIMAQGSQDSCTRQIRLQLDADKLTIRAEDLDMSSEAKETIDCDYSNESMEIGFNAKYLSDVLQNIDGDEVSFEFSSPNKAGIVKPTQSDESEEMLMLVMTVMLNSYS